MKQLLVLNNSKKAWGGKRSPFQGFLPSLIALIMVVTPLSQAKSEVSGLQTMVYEVYAGGFHAVQAKFEIDLRKNGRYDMKIAAKTRGVLGAMAPWKGLFESQGWALGEGLYRPELHKSTTTWRDEIETKAYKYAKNGDFEGLVITDFEREPYTKEIDDELAKDTTDAFSATLQIMSAIAKNGQCAGESEIFDGKRRFKQIFHHQGLKPLKASKYNIYEGEAAQCTIEVVPLAGAWHKKPRGWMSIQEQGRELGMMPTVWMAQMHEGAPAIPVKLRVKTQYGTLFMHLAEYRQGEEIIVAKKRVYDKE